MAVVEASFVINRCTSALRCSVLSAPRRFRRFQINHHLLLSRNITTNVPMYDVVVVGGGIVGMATARELSIRHPALKLAVLEKENRIAAHQSGHNSGVIHAGIYYTPGSLKAKLCTQGLNLTYEYCDKYNIPYKKCGKLIVAVEKHQLPQIDVLYERGLKNNVRDMKMIGPQQMKEIEPYCKGLKAIWSPHTGIVDWAEVTSSYAHNFESAGGKIHLNFHVQGFDISAEGKIGSINSNSYPVTITSNQKQTVRCRYVVTCGGLYSDKVSQLSGCASDPRIIPFRGEYLLLKPNKCHLVRGNIYPVPDPKFPFLGVHFTPRMDGSVWLGPNALLAFRREGYKLTDISPTEFLDAIRFRGLQKFLWRHTSAGMGELFRSFSITAQVRELQKFIPQIETCDVLRGPSGVRAQAMNSKGELVDDFVFDSGPGDLGKRMLHVRNAPSPGATSSLAIAKMVADKVKEKFDF